MQWLHQELKANPKIMKTMKNVVRMKQSHADWDKATHFHPDLEGRSVSRVPQKYLALEFFPSLGDVTLAEMQTLVKADSKVAHKMLYRLLIIESTDPLGPLNIKDWAKIYTHRMVSLGFSMKHIFWNRNFEVGWQRSGLYHLEPALTPGVDPGNHSFTHLSVFGHKVELPEDVRFRAHWVVEENWSLKTAFLSDPTKPGMMRFPCYDLFHATCVQDKVVPMFVQDGGEETKMDALSASPPSALCDATSATPQAADVSAESNGSASVAPSEAVSTSLEGLTAAAEEPLVATSSPEKKKDMARSERNVAKTMNQLHPARAAMSL
eukprot:3325908-Amphidinium_carterae.1